MLHLSHLSLPKNANVPTLVSLPIKKSILYFFLRGENAADPASASSNHLAKVLDLQGKVLIGDAALKYYLSGGEGIDLAEAWHQKTNLPFVFARLCYNKHGKAIEKLAKKFGKTKVKIPQIYFKKRSRKTGYHSEAINVVFGADLLYDGVQRETFTEVIFRFLGLAQPNLPKKILYDFFNRLFNTRNCLIHTQYSHYLIHT